MIDRIVAMASGVRAAVAVAAVGVVGMPVFRLSPYADLKSLIGGASLPEETVTSPSRLAEVLEVLGVEGRGLYLQFQIWDLVNPFLIGGAGAMLLGWLLKRSRRAGSQWRFVVLFPVAALGADLLENLVILIAVGAFPDLGAVANALPVVTAIKFGAVLATVVAVVGLVLLWTLDSRRSAGRRMRDSGGH